MPQIYDRPAKSLIADWAKANLKPGQTFSKSDVVRWFAEHYPKLKRSTIAMHVDFMSVNSPSRVWEGSSQTLGLFFKLGPDQYRLWNWILMARHCAAPRPRIETSTMTLDRSSLTSATYKIILQKISTASSPVFAYTRMRRSLRHTVFCWRETHRYSRRRW